MAFRTIFLSLTVLPLMAGCVTSRKIDICHDQSSPLPVNPEYYTSAALAENGETFPPGIPDTGPHPLVPLNPEYYTSAAIAESGETLPAGIPDIGPHPLVPLNPEYYTSAAIVESGETLTAGITASPCPQLP